MVFQVVFLLSFCYQRAEFHAFWKKGQILVSVLFCDTGPFGYMTRGKCNICYTMLQLFMNKSTPVECSETYFGENTLQTNKWFLINSNTIVYAVNRIEFKVSGTRQGKPSIVWRRCPELTFWVTRQPFTDM